MNYYSAIRSKVTKFTDFFFYLIIFLLPFERAFLDENLKGAFLQYFIIAFSLISLLSFRRYYCHWNFALLAFAFFLFVGTISDILTLGAFTPNIGWALLRSWVGFYLMVPAYNLTRNDPVATKRILYLLLWFSLAISICSLLGIGVEEMGTERGVEGSRVQILGANANESSRDVSLFMLFSFLTLMGVIKCKNWKKVVFALLSMVSFAALLKTGSRGGLAALVIGLLSAIFTANSISKRAWCFILIVVVGIAGVMVVLTNVTLMDRLAKVVYERDSGGREFIFQQAIYLWTKSKALGLGCIAYRFPLGDLTGMSQRATHNTYIWALVSAGIIGAPFYYLSLLNILKNSFKVRFTQGGSFMFVVVVMALFGGMVINLEQAKWSYILYGTILGFSENLRMLSRKGLNWHLGDVDF